MGRVKASDLREKYFLNKGIKKFRRLRQVWIKRFGLWFFKDVDSELAKAQVKKIDEDIHDQESLNAYMAKLMSRKMDINKPLWEILVKEDYDEDTSIVFVLVHHILSDGMGIMSLVTFMNDNHNPDNMGSHRSIPFFAYYLLPLIYLP